MAAEGEARRSGLRGLMRSGRTRRADLDEARAMQVQALPDEPPQLAGFQIAVAWRPSREVSGDYFDVIPLSGQRVALCIADVSGRGMSAVQLMLDLQTAVRGMAEGAASPSELCTQVNQALCHPGPQTRYATMFYAVLEGTERRLHYESAGHCLPLLVRGDGSIEFPASFSGVVGIFSHWLYQNQELQLRPGDCLLLLTDGVVEAENRSGEEFGYQRLIRLVENGRALEAARLGERILTEVGKFCGGKFEDDASLMVVKVA